MNKLLARKSKENQSLNNSLEYNHSKSIGKRREKGNVYFLSRIDETYGQKNYKLNYFNLNLFTMGNHSHEYKPYFKPKSLKKIMRKDQILINDSKISNKKVTYKKKDYNNYDLLKPDLDYNYKIKTNINKYFKNNFSLLNEKVSEIESKLDSLWKSLGVNDNYITNFNSYKNMLNNTDEKKVYMLNEIENLEKFKDVLSNLSKEINIRESKLGEIKNLFDKINNEDDSSNLKKILNESYASIIAYIENSIRVVEYYLLFKETINHGNTKNIKFNEDVVKKLYDINKNDMNYLIKMKTDTNFINATKIGEFKLNKSTLNLFKADPFLSCLYTIIQIPFEVKEKVKYCQYFIIQESIFESLNKKMKDPMAMSHTSKKNAPTHISIDANNKNTNSNTDLDVSYFSGKISEFIPLYSEYFEKIPEEQKLIFNLQQDPLKYFEHNYFPKIIICKDKETQDIKGICIYSMRFKWHEKKPNEIILEHMSSYNQEEMENIISKIFEFIKNNNMENNVFKTASNESKIEVIINLYYNFVNDKFEINKNIKDFIEKKLKFKSVKLENVSESVRYHKMRQIITNENNGENSEDNNNNLCSNFLIKDNFNINLVEKIMKNNGNSDSVNIREMNPFNIIYISHLMKKIYNIKSSFGYLIRKLNKYSTRKDLLLKDANNDVAMTLVLNEDFNNDLNIKTLPEDLQCISKFITGNLKDELDISNKLNISPLFDGCLSMRYKNYFYNRIECKNIKIFNEKGTQQIFYLLNTVNDKNISMLISSNLNADFKNKYLSFSNGEEKNNHFNGVKNFEEMFNSLEELNSDGKEISKYIYIPAFSIEQKYEQSNIENYDEYVKNVINRFNEEYKIEFLTEELIIKKNKKINNSLEFNITEEEIKNKNEYLIDDEFMIFILDDNVINNIGIIPILDINVHKDNFISDNEIGNY